MSKITAKSRNELLRMYDNERSDKRCSLTRSLVKEADELTSEIDVLISETESTLAEQHQAKNDILKANAMYGVKQPRGHYCSAEETHPKLIKFDAATNKRREEILLM